MQYGKTANGSLWHMVVDGKTLCYLPPRTKIVELKERSEVPDSEICQNCDEHLRKKGKGARIRQPRPNPKEHYRPRFKLED